MSDRGSRRQPEREAAFGNSALKEQLASWKKSADARAPAKPAPRAVQHARPSRAAPSDPPDVEEALFRAAMEDVAPLPRHAADGEPPPGQRTAQEIDEDAEAFAKLAELVATGEGFDLADTDEYIEGAARNVDRGLLERLRRGEFSVQAHLDLHGLLADPARIELERFLTDSRRRGHRSVLVVHGRGLHSKDQEPVLKNRMGAWLTRGKLARIVLAFATARPADGGAGALYVLLRR